MNTLGTVTGPSAISIKEACAYCGLGRTSIYSQIKAGRLASIKIGTRRLIRVAELERWLSAQEKA
jgi:excisionase family DNA binding protein